MAACNAVLSQLPTGAHLVIPDDCYQGVAGIAEAGAATAAYDIAVEQYNRTLVEALRGVSDQLIRLHSLHEQEIFVGHGLETAERRYQLAEEAYRRGLTDYRRVLEAQSALFDGDLSAEQWANLGVAGTIWLVLPLAVGLWLLMRSEVK